MYATLKARIAAGHYSAGYRLVIDALSRELGVSPIPVREAIRRLQAEGLVRHRPNVGAEVARIEESELAEMMVVMARLAGWATSLASTRLSEEDLSRLSGLAHAMSDALDSYQLERYADLNRQFHHDIRQACPNRFLAQLVDDSGSRLDRIRHDLFLAMPQRARESLQDHYHLVQSLREKAPTHIVEALAERHELKTRDAYLAYCQQRPLAGAAGDPLGGRE